MKAQKKEEKEELEEEEIKKALRKIKLRKATSIDGIPTEASAEKWTRERGRREKNDPRNSSRFQKRKIDNYNIFAIMHIQREESKKGEDDKVFMFADLKAAFDKMDRSKLWDCLREKGIRESLVRRIEKTYEGTEIMIRTKLGNTESFVTKSVRQRCVMSPLLFNLYIADLDEKFRSRDIGGLDIDKQRIFEILRMRI
ncbi:PREDICTED: uncharacterized protein LOC105617843 [Atta cephalotes]|uniref:Reverse transcriptase domain-containing protein n=1 Tax=Atta cephalotes TaxID=12957 RepID=A0A158NB76_ATTCE|nr:PREDICTED: uncharacterized protein LOC105617843 [Atta cephalotes]